MGYSLTWLACRGASLDAVLSCLSLNRTNEVSEYARAPIAAQPLSADWTLVVASGCGHRIGSEQMLAALSEGCEVVACSVEEHVNFASAQYWLGGSRAWHVEHSWEKSPQHLAVEGAPPSILESVRREREALQRVDDEVDYFFDIPLECAKHLTGFKHDEEHPGLQYDSFVVLEPSRTTTRNRSWWKF
jgi:hypothetical protein